MLRQQEETNADIPPFESAYTKGNLLILFAVHFKWSAWSETPLKLDWDTDMEKCLEGDVASMSKSEAPSPSTASKSAQKISSSVQLLSSKDKPAKSSNTRPRGPDASNSSSKMQSSPAASAASGATERDIDKNDNCAANETLPPR